jgi:DNA-binding transcriptional MocR family regulator
MTIWTPEIDAMDGPRYQAIAQALAADVASGRLAPGARLPTHRNLAYRLGVTVGTVSRAYAEAQRKGLTTGEVGRGTYVQGGGDRLARRLDLTIQDTAPELFDFSLNLPARGPAEQALAATLGELTQSGGLSPFLDYQPDTGMRHHRAAGAKWLAEIGIDARPDQVAVTNGAQNGMMMAFSAAARPGDTVLTESVTYPGIKEVAALMNLRLVGVPMDEFGLLPEALEEACAARRPSTLYCIPTLQNPTSRIMPEPRRRDIADIARSHGVTIIEDDVYGLLPKHRPPSLAAIAPDITIYITSISKTIAPGLRVGYVYAQEEMLARIGAAMRGNCRMATPLMAEIVTRWIEEGSARRMNEWQRDEVSQRQAITAQALAGLDYETDPDSYHLWLSLPEPWRAEEFVTQVRARKVVVMPAEAFAVGRGQPPHAVRVCLGQAQSHEHLRTGLSIIAETLENPFRPAQTVV